MRNNKKTVAFVIPSFIGVTLLYFVPFCIIIYYSFVNNIVSKKFVFLDNYKNLLKNEAFILASINTLKFSCISVPLLIVFALYLANMLEEKISTYSIFRSSFLTPIMAPTASIVLVWQAVFHAKGGLGYLFNIDWLKSKYGILVVAVLFIWKNLGYDMILFLAALASVPKELIEVAIIENATPCQIFFRIKIRYIFTSIVFTTIISLINSFKVFRETYLLTGDYPYEAVYFLQTFMNNVIKSLDYQRLSAAAVIMSIVMIIVISIMFWIESIIGKGLET